MGTAGKSMAAIGGCVLIGIAAAFAYFQLSREETVALLAWDDATVVARGRVLYAAQCAGCHGQKGEGQVAVAGSVPAGPLAPPHDGSGHTSQHPDFALVQLTKQGVSDVTCQTLDENGMPQFQEVLSDREILDILAYVKSRWPAAIRAEHDKVNRLYSDYNAAMKKLLKLPRT